MPATYISRLGGLTRAATHDGLTVTHKARDAFDASFADGHDCSVCPRIEIPVELPLVERERRAAALRRAHYIRIATLPRSRAKKAATASSSAVTAQEEARRVSDATTAS